MEEASSLVTSSTTHPSGVPHTLLLNPIEDRMNKLTIAQKYIFSCTQKSQAHQIRDSAMRMYPRQTLAQARLYKPSSLSPTNTHLTDLPDTTCLNMSLSQSRDWEEDNEDNSIKMANTVGTGFFRWGQLKNMYVECSRDIPMNDVLSYPYCIFVSKKLIYNVLNIFLHVLPACIMDIFLILWGKKPMMIKANEYLNQLLTAVEYFVTREWIFHRCNIIEMMMKVKTLEESNIVKLDMEDIDWKKYVTNYHLGIKKFIIKENSESVNLVRRSSLYVSKYLGAERDIIMVIF
ncbi:Fatty acyl-CoA reductase 1 [Melipona quadrifasciata]|uniref:Fatty acyl-CoA reductase 1 n=1 Tax=Melipona quadrifasciata TaxID=166423 RepID=A0A0M8ZT92_9HYME|nr:Fatty acyl-CoA reductase 1 [Melipona quadrifasciata]